ASRRLPRDRAWGGVPEAGQGGASRHSVRVDGVAGGAVEQDSGSHALYEQGLIHRVEGRILTVVSRCKAIVVVRLRAVRERGGGRRPPIDQRRRDVRIVLEYGQPQQRRLIDFVQVEKAGRVYHVDLDPLIPYLHPAVRVGVRAGRHGAVRSSI